MAGPASPASERELLPCCFVLEGRNPFNLAFPTQLRRFVSWLLARYLPGAGLRKLKFVYIFKE